MENYFYIPVEPQGNEYFQYDVLPSDQLFHFREDNYQNVIDQHFQGEEAVVSLSTGKFLTVVYKPLDPNLGMYFCRVNERNYPNNDQEIKLNETAIKKLKENLSLKVTYSEGIVADQQIDIISHFVTPRIKFSNIDEVEYYHHRKFRKDCIIFGAPGSGKTTMLRRLTIDILEHNFETVDFHLKILPIYIQLRDFNHFEADFTTFIDNSIKNCFSDSGYMLESQNYSWSNLYLMLDGADEIDFEKFHLFAETISNYKYQNPYASFIITSRPDRKYEKIKDFQICSVEPFTKSQIKELTYRKLGKNNHWKDFISMLNIVPPIYEMLKNPLLLTLTHFLYQHKSVLPTNTAQLLKEFVSALVSNWDSQRNVERRFQDKVINPIEITHLLGLMAYYMSESQTQEIKVRELFDALGKYDTVEELSLFLEYIKFSTGLIHTENDTHWSFRFKSIQDYFCSSFLVESVNGLKEQIFKEKNWTNVLQIISGLSSNPGVVMSNILNQGELAEEDKITTALSFYNETILFNKYDIALIMESLESYFNNLENDQYFRNLKISSGFNNVSISNLPISTRVTSFVKVITALFDVRFSKYEYDFHGYLAKSNSVILKAFYPLSLRKGNITVKNEDDLIRVTYEDESPQIEN